MMMGGAFALFLTMIFLKKGNEIREKAISFVSLWLLIWTPVTAVGALLYRATIPNAMMGNLPLAIVTRREYINEWYESILFIILGAVIVSVLVALWGFLKPKKLPRAALVIPIIVMCILLGSFERVREFIRKPFVIGEYMYANGLRVEDYPLYKKNGVLSYATYVNTPQVTEENKLEAGENVFMIACSRCHTVTGINSVVRKFHSAYKESLSEKNIKDFISNKMYKTKTWYYMPPFPGNEAELDALTAFILQMDKNPKYIQGAQTQGVKISPTHSWGPNVKNTDKKGS
jgi:hypothetical protein